MFIRTLEVAQPPGAATGPSPGNGDLDVPLDAELSWVAGAGALSHDVYFGTTSDPPFVANVTEASYYPGTLGPSTTYYWRIDEVNGAAVTEGDVWQFTTAASCEPTTMHVQAIECGIVRSGTAYKGSVRVTIVSNCGEAVSGVTVTGAFTGTYNEVVSAATGADGVAVLVTTTTAKKPAYTLTVQGATHATLTYDPGANVETSDSY
jgi:hypothetical protein